MNRGIGISSYKGVLYLHARFITRCPPVLRQPARFRKDRWSELSELFKDSVRVCAESGLVFLNVVSVDGSKIRASASRKSVYDTKRLEREIACVERMLKEAEEVDQAEDEKLGDSNGRSMPAGLRSASERKAKIESREASKREQTQESGFVGV